MSSCSWTMMTIRDTDYKRYYTGCHASQSFCHSKKLLRQMVSNASKKSFLVKALLMESVPRQKLSWLLNPSMRSIYLPPIPNCMKKRTNKKRLFSNAPLWPFVCHISQRRKAVNISVILCRGQQNNFYFNLFTKNFAEWACRWLWFNTSWPAQFTSISSFRKLWQWFSKRFLLKILYLGETLWFCKFSLYMMKRWIFFCTRKYNYQEKICWGKLRTRQICL